MKWKTWAPAVLAVVLGGAAAKLARDSMMKPRAVQVVEKKSVQIVTANADLMVGQELRPGDVALTAIPTATAPPESFGNVADTIGRVVNSPMLKGQTILQTNLEVRGAGGGLNTFIPPGMRAMTITVDETNGLSGMLLPGSRVDIMATLIAGKESFTRTLITNVLVQAVGQRLSTAKSPDGKEPPPYHTVTIIVSPHDCEVIELASSSARIRLLLRGPIRNDTNETDPAKVSLTDIGFEKPIVPVVKDVAKVAPEPPKVVYAPPKKTLEIIRGSGGAVTRLEYETPHPTVDVEADQGKVFPDKAFPDEKPEE